MSTILNDLKFQFRYVSNGQAAGFGTGKGTATENGLQLGKEELPFNSIGDTYCRDSRLVLRIDPANLHEKIIKYQQSGILVLEIGKPGAELLKRAIDHKVSRRRADEAKRRLNHLGPIEALRQETCGRCQCVIEASGTAKTTFLYCPYCDTILRQDATTRQYQPAVTAPGAELRVCDDCGYFGRVKGYTEFYFYFLLVVYGYHSKRIHVCDSCADRVFWKNFLINAIFILGLTPALWLKISASRGRTEDWKKLAKANGMANKGNVQGAVPLYNELLQKHPDYPGFLLNQAIAHAQTGDPANARNYIKRTLDACSNYTPAQRLQDALAQITTGTQSGPAIPLAPQVRTDNPLTTHT